MHGSNSISVKYSNKKDYLQLTNSLKSTVISRFLGHSERLYMYVLRKKRRKKQVPVFEEEKN